MKLADRLTLAFSTTVGAVLVGSFALVYVLVQRDEERDLDRVLRVQAARMASEIGGRAAVAGHDLDRASALPEGPQLTVLRAALYDGRGDVVSATSSFAGRPPPLASLHVPDPVTETGAVVELHFDAVPLRGVVLPVDARGARLLYAVPRGPIDDDLNFLLRCFAGIAAVGIVLTHLVARWLAARLVRDVAWLTEVAETVAEGRLDARVGEGARGSNETRALGLAIDHMIGRLDALVSAQQTFLSHAAHELRSPLATLRGELQLALRRPREPEAYKETLEALLCDVEQLTALAEDLLTLARIQGHGPGARIEVSLEDLVGDAVKMAKGRADARGVELRVDLEVGAGLRVSGSRLDLVRALRNLLDNAVAHANPREAVRVGAREGRASLTVAVENPGRPVPPEEAEHLFAPFFRGSEEQAGESGGAGLGLAIARGIARAHDGDVTLDPTYTGGARFVLTLPVVASGAIE